MSLVNSYEPDDDDDYDADTLQEFNLTSHGFGNKNYGEFSYHKKYFEVRGIKVVLNFRINIILIEPFVIKELHQWRAFLLWHELSDWSATVEGQVPDVR